jgi:hypothetical protein
VRRFVGIAIILVIAGTGGALGASRSSQHVYVARPGDVLSVPGSKARCAVGRELTAVRLVCRHTPAARYSVVFYSDNLVVYRNGNPARIVFSARGRP